MGRILELLFWKGSFEILAKTLVVIEGNLCHYYSALFVFSENMGLPLPIKIIFVKKCPKLLRIYGSWYTIGSTPLVS